MGIQKIENKRLKTSNSIEFLSFENYENFTQ